ncbi:MAG: hypothetical protein JO235_10430 [Chroococcidiopsidaceae cyanobacterium CP_BM_RX_35]|nr:hypothetical protein [Chroococcidiopsidaceae cyanobacterium CP_BM_RX_35]
MNFTELQEKFHISLEVTKKTLEACGLSSNQAEYTEEEVERFSIARQRMADGLCRSYNDVRRYFAEVGVRPRTTEPATVHDFQIDMQAAAESAESLAQDFEQVVAIMAYERIQQMHDSGEMHAAALQLIQERGLGPSKFSFLDKAEEYLKSRRQSRTQLVIDSSDLKQLPESTEPSLENQTEDIEQVQHVQEDVSNA